MTRIPDMEAPRHDHNGERPGRVWPWLSALVVVVGCIAFMNPDDTPAPPPEPVDPITRQACRDWQVVLAVTGIEDVAEKTRADRLILLVDFMPRAEKVAGVEEAQQETFLAVVDAIAGARKVRDTAGRTAVEEALTLFAEDLAAVHTTCEQD